MTSFTSFIIMRRIKFFKIVASGLLALGVSPLLLAPNNLDTALNVEAAIDVRSIDTTNLSDTQLTTYYSSAANLRGEQLQSALHDIIKGHTSFRYSDTKDIMKITDRDWVLSPLTEAELANYNFNNHTGIGDPYLKLLYGGNYNGTEHAVKWSENHVLIWNKEHTWAKSHGDFGELQPAGTDLHHLIGADAQINRYHSNLDYGIPTLDITPRVDVRGFATTAANGKNEDSPNANVFLPPVEDRGDIARALFYMETRYYNYVSLADPKLVIVDDVTSSTHVATSNENPGKMGWRKVLLDWHKSDPVDEYEIHRNNLIFNNFQGNRNPFIDHPEYADLIYDPIFSGPSSSASGACTMDYCAYYEPSTAELQSISVSSASNNTHILNTVYHGQGLQLDVVLEDGTRYSVAGSDPDVTTSLDGVLLDTIGFINVDVSYTRYERTLSDTFTIIVEEAPPVSDVNHVLINEIYGGGGNSGAKYTHDFVELYNPTYAPIDLSGYKIERYTASATNNSSPTSVSEIRSGVIPALGYFLVQEARGSGGTDALPSPDFIGNNAFAASSAAARLVDADGNEVDLVGFGNAQLFEGAAAPAASNTISVQRINPNVDTNDNSADFTTGVPTPLNSPTAYIAQFERQVALNPNPYCNGTWGYLDDNYAAVNANNHLDWFKPSAEAKQNYIYLISQNNNLTHFLEFEFSLPAAKVPLKGYDHAAFLIIIVTVALIALSVMTISVFRIRKKD